MKIERTMLPRMTIEEFAISNHLVMEVHERSPRDGPTRFYAHFKNAETSDGCILAGVFGDGRTEEDAINNYAEQISGKLLVVDAFREQRREILVPVLVKNNGTS